MDAIGCIQQKGQTGTFQHIRCFGNGARGWIPERTGRLALGATGVNRPTGKERGHIVEHDRHDHLVGTSCHLEQARQCAPDHAAEHPGQDRQGQVDDSGQPFEIDANRHGRNRPHEKLT